MIISTKNLLYDPFNPATTQELTERFDEFRQPIGHLKIEKVVAWIVLMYDLKSELRMQFPDWRERKIQAAVLAGWEANKYAVFQDSVMEMLNGENEAVNDMIIRYCLLFSSPSYVSYIATWEMLIRETRASLSATESKVIETIRKNIAEFNKQIEDYATKIFGGESSIGLHNALFKTINREKLRLRPEAIAQDIKNKDLDLEDVYYEEGEEEIKESNAGRPKGSQNKLNVIYKRKKGRPRKYVQKI